MSSKKAEKREETTTAEIGETATARVYSLNNKNRCA